MNKQRILVVVALFLCASLGFAQTSGTLSTQTSSPYSTAPWVITSGPGTYPDGGGVATFAEQINNILGTPPAVPTITIDVPITLSGLVFNSAFQYILASSAGNPLTFAAGGLTLNVIKSNLSSPTAFAAGDVLSAVLAGSGGLTKTGAGIITVAGTNTYTGGTAINGGVLRTTVGDVAFGATGAGNDIAINGGTLRVSTTALTTARNITLGAAGATIELFANATITGNVTGAGSLAHNVGSTLALNGANTYTGATTQNAGTISLGTANGTIASSSSYDLAGILTLDNAAANNNNRISDTATITARGATINVIGNASAATAESAGAMNLASGNNIITVTPNAAQSASLNLASVNRQNNSTLFVRGTNLGAAAAAGVAQITATTPPVGLIGGGGAAGSTTISILPWAVGNLSAAATLGSSFVTYGATGFRPLAASEYAAAVGGSPTDNVRITAAAASPAGTVNSLVFAPGATATLSGGPINITSGAFLYSPTATATGTVSAGLNFGAAEGLIHTSNTLTISGVISGSNGVTYNSFAGSAVTVSGANTYTGATRINSGQLSFGGTIDSVTAGPLGQTSAPIILNVGSLTTRMWVNADSTINRDISVQGNPSVAFTAGLGATATFNVTLNGNLDLQRRVLIENGSTLPFTINGVVSGPGSISDAFASLVVLNGNNTYSGGTEIQTGTYQLGSDTALGTGTVYFTGLGFMRGSGTTSRTIANDFLYNTTTATYSGTAPLTFTGTHNLNGSRTFAITNTAPTTFSGLLTDGAVTKTGTGVLSIARSIGNTYTGGTVLGTSAGILNLNNSSGSATGAGTVSIGGSSAANRSTLSGNFRIAGNTQDSGVLSPGNGVALNGIGDIGTGNFDANLTLTSNSLVNLELASTVSFDKINVGGILNLGSANFVVMTIGGFVAQAGNSFDLVDWGGGVTGTATIDVSGAALAPGTSWDTSTFTLDGTIRVVPEPSTWAMLALGLGSLTAAMRLRRR